MGGDLTAKDLGFENDQEPLDALDLPQIYTRPSAATLLLTLSDLKSEPSSWETTPRSGNSRAVSGTTTPLHRRRKIKSEGVPAYLTKIVSSALQWIDDDGQKEQIWETASQELSARSGRTAQGDITRTFAIPLLPAAAAAAADDEPKQYSTADEGLLVVPKATLAEDEDFVELLLHEPALTADNLGFKTWASSFMLAKRLCCLKSELSSASVLELGAGTGLVGMAAACVLNAHVVMTDLPEIVTNLERNAKSNAAVIHSHGGHISTAVLDWMKPDALIVNEHKYPSQQFSLILAADVVYSQEHPRMLADTIAFHMKRAPEARLVVASPLREGYNTELSMLQKSLIAIDLVRSSEGEETGYDDWADMSDNEPKEVKCSWSVWKWS